MKIKFSSNFKAIQNRIKKLPQYQKGVVKAINKSMADSVIKEFQSGLFKNDLGLKPLKESTIGSKRKKGYKKPGNPLYGAGKNEKNSYYNSLKVFETKNGYSVRPRSDKEHDAKITLKQLFNVHEYGALIKKGDTVIRIPARFALKKAYDRVMFKRSKLDYNKDVMTAINKFVVQGNTKLFKVIQDKANV